MAKTPLHMRNGSTPLLWTVRPGLRRERSHVGTVLAEIQGSPHRYAVWSVFSDDGVLFDAVGGIYCHTLPEATSAWAERARTLGGDE